jgi:hypothetical protein
LNQWSELSDVALIEPVEQLQEWDEESIAEVVQWLKSAATDECAATFKACHEMMSTAPKAAKAKVWSQLTESERSILKSFSGNLG